MPEDVRRDQVTHFLIITLQEVVQDSVVAAPGVGQELDELRVYERRVDKGEFPHERGITGVVPWKDRQNCLIDGLVVAELIQEVRVYRADGVVRSELL